MLSALDTGASGPGSSAAGTLRCVFGQDTPLSQCLTLPRCIKWFILQLLLTTPTMQFLFDRKRRSHKQNQCSASDPVGLIFTTSYRSTLLITTPTMTPSGFHWRRSRNQKRRAKRSSDN